MHVFDWGAAFKYQFVSFWIQLKRSVTILRILQQPDLHLLVR